MSNSVSRPRKGLTADQAFARWSDPEKYKELVVIAETSEVPNIMDMDRKIRDPLRRKEYRSKRDALDDAFRERLLNEEIFASGIYEYGNRREVIHPTLWGMLEIAYELDCIVGMKRTYEKPEFFRLDSIPLNIRPVPDWLDAELGAAGLNAFRYDRDYRHIVLHGIEYSLSPLHAKVVALLHEAWLAGDPWQNGKDILQRAGSTQFKMVDVFKSREDWRALIETDGKSMYRLRMEPPVDH
jgi:hypothetical protein